MAKSYAKNNRKHSNGFRRSLVSVLVSFLCGYVFASFITFSQMSAWFKQTLMPSYNQPAVKQAENKPVLPKPKLEFYTLLTKENSSRRASENNVPLKKASQPTAKTREQTAHKVPVKIATPTPTPSPSKVSASFMVQIASFKKKQDAERMKATLILQDFKTSIAQARRDNTTWYRVMIGPFKSRIQAEKAQVEVAKTENIMGMIRKMEA